MEELIQATSSVPPKPRSGVIILDPSLFFQERHGGTECKNKTHKTTHLLSRIADTGPIFSDSPQSSTTQTQIVELINEELFDKNNVREKRQLKRYSEPLTDPIEVLHSKENVQNALDKVNCGFVTAVEGVNRSYYLRCFYCSFEFPICKWDAFCDHVNEIHRELENKYENSDDVLLSAPDKEVTSVETSAPTFNRKEVESRVDKSKIKCNGKESIDFSNPLINETLSAMTDISEPETALLNSLETSSSSFSDTNINNLLCGNEETLQNTRNYNPNVDHSYSQEASRIKCNIKRIIGLNDLPNDFSKIKDNIEEVYDMDTIRENCNEIRFGKTDRIIVMDFLERLKSYPCLWYTHLDSLELYEKSLSELLFKMNNHWNIKLTESVFISNLECIKRYYNASITNQNYKKSRASFAKYAEYIRKCSEIPYVDNKGKYNTPMMRSNEPLLALLLPKKIRRKFAEKKEKRYFCPRCNKGFFLEFNYNNHVQLHSKEIRPFKCDICNRRYLTQNKLQQHKKRHDPPKYVCKICPKKYYFSYNFEMHMKTHTGSIECVCEWCGQTFVNDKQYISHVKYKHNTGGFCNICRKPMQTAAALEKHLNIYHRPFIDTGDNLKYAGYPLQKKQKIATSKSYRRSKYKFIIDPETKKRRICCPNCDKQYFGYDSLYTHISKIHGYEPSKRTRIVNPHSKGRWPKKQTNAKDYNKGNASMIVNGGAEKVYALDQEDFHIHCSTVTNINYTCTEKGMEQYLVNDEINYTTPSFTNEIDIEKNYQNKRLNETNVEDVEFNFMINKVMDASYL